MRRIHNEKNQSKRKITVLSLGFFVFLIVLLPNNTNAQLTGVTIEIDDTTVNASSRHKIEFYKSASPGGDIPGDGKIVILYPSGFDFSKVDTVLSDRMDGTWQFYSAGDSITIERNGDGTPEGSLLKERLFILDVTNHTTVRSDYTVTVKTKNNDDTLIDEGVSNTFSLYPEEMDQFAFSGLPSNVEAGDQFPVTITAQDEYGNTATGFTGPGAFATLSDETGTLSITTGGGGNTTTGFSSGIWNGQVQITQTHTSNMIAAKANGKTSNSGLFSVDPTNLDYFTFGAISSPRTAGAAFSISITAYDDFDNIKTDYGLSGENVALNDQTGSLSITSNGSGNTTNQFTTGAWSGNVRITQTLTDNYITANGSYYSGQFNVNPASADTFTFSTIVDQEVGEPFLISITARDPFNNVATGFQSTASLSDLTGTIQIRDNGSGTTTNNFTAGVWHGNVVVDQIQVQPQNRISAASTGVDGVSNDFRVDSTSSVDHFDVTIASIGTPKTAGSPFSVTIEAIDVYGNPADYSGNVTLFDETGTNSPQQVFIQNGSWTGTVTIEKVQTGMNSLTVAGAGEGGVSGDFEVVANSVATFEIDPIASPQRAGSFSIHITAYDAWGNIATGFHNQTVSMDVIASETISISPATSGAFSNGQRTQTVEIRVAAQDLQIHVEDTGNHEGTSNLFNIIHHTTLQEFVIGTVADQAAGVPFPVSVTAVDPYGNTYTSFTGAGNSVTISHSGTGNITPQQSGDFDAGKWIGNVTVSEVQDDDQIRVVRLGGGPDGWSNPFDVDPGVVSYFEMDPIPGPVVAGEAFQIRVRAYDAQGNLVTDNPGTFNVNIYDETGTIYNQAGTGRIQQISLISGVGTEFIQIQKRIDNNTLTVSGQGKGGISNEFDVDPAAVHHFKIDEIGSPRFSTQSFTLTITARDRFENTADDHIDPVFLSDSTGTIQPAQSGSFIGGVRTVSVQITEARNDVRIWAYLGSGERGASNLFNVLPGPLDHFVFNEITDQIAGHPFSIAITAFDEHDNIKTDFRESVNLIDETGTITPTVSPNFVNGVMTGGVTIYNIRTDNIITAAYGNVSSPSDPPFDVVLDPGIQVFNLRALWKDATTQISSITTNQDSLWFLTCHVRNMSGSNTRLDSIRLSVTVNNQQRSDFTFILPTQFWGNGTENLGGGALDSLLIPITHTGSRSGPAIFQVTAFIKKLDTGATLSDDAVTNLLVQTDAAISVNEVRVKNPLISKSEVTQGQEENWSVSVVVTNQGQSHALIDSSASATYLDFGIGSQDTWTVSRPPFWTNGDWILEGGETDTLKYIIDETTNANSGSCSIDAFIEGTEINTGKRLAENTLDAGSGTVKIEEPAALRILSLRSLAPNAPYVNRSQSFNIQVRIQNPGEDASLSSVLGISQFHSFFPTSHSAGNLSGGEVKIIEIGGTASAVENQQDVITVHAAGTAENTQADVNDQFPVDDTTRVITQIPATMNILSLVPSVTKLIGGQTDPWTVKVVIRNPGQATLDLDPPKADSLSFWVEGLRQEDYNVIAPAGLSGRGGLALPGGATDTLIYTVNTTGTYGGTVGILASVGGKDRNDLKRIWDSDNTTVAVETEEAFRIIQTQIVAINTTDAKNGCVNTGQDFSVLVILENALGNTIRNIQVQLNSNGSSQIEDPTALIGTLSPSKRDSLLFSVQAAATENLNGEVFISQIISAKRENLVDDAPVGRSFDSTATVIIQTRAELSLELTLDPASGTVSINQPFTVQARLIKTGSSQLKNDGRVTLIPPGGYHIISDTDTSSITPAQPASWILEAPNDTSSNDQIVVRLDRYPREMNTNDKAYVANNSAHISITTIRSYLFAAVSISEPEGAMDGIVSSGQNFTVKVAAGLYNVKDAKAKIDLPSGYVTQNNITQVLNPDTAIWQITAPSSSQPDDEIQMVTWGHDVLQPGVEVGRDTSIIPVQTVLRADLSLALEIISPPEAAQYGTVSLGQQFVVRANVVNHGEAMTEGGTRVSLLSLPQGFITNDPLSKTLFSNEASWTIQAPDQITEAITKIEARISQTPQDVNTSQPAHVSRDYHSVALTLEGAALAVSSFSLPAGAKQELSPGQQNVAFMRIQLKNDGQEGAYNIQVKRIHFYLEDRNGNPLSPVSALSRLEVIDDRNAALYGGVTQISSSNPLTVEISGLIVTVEQKAQNENPIILVRGNIADSETAPYFQLNLPGTDAIEAIEANTGRVVSVTDPTGESWENMRSMPMKIFDPNQDYRLWNSPNPFGRSGRGTTTIYFYMPEQEAVEFRIFTLVGQLVKTVQMDQEDITPDQINHWEWDGTNDKGIRVLNGVYHLFMRTSDRQVFKHKIAYVK